MYKFLGELIKNYVDNHSEEILITYSPKSIFEELKYEADKDIKDSMNKRLSKELKQKKVTFVNGAGFKIPSSFFDKTFEEHLISFEDIKFD